MKADLIAPCGMNCRLCYGCIRPRNQCLGCRGSDENKPKSCTSCKIVTCKKRLENNWQTCAPCDTHCRRLKDLDKRYRMKYHMSMIENLVFLRENGMDAFLTQQKKRFTCPSCGEIVCVHRNECPLCNAPIWEEKTKWEQ